MQGRFVSLRVLASFPASLLIVLVVAVGAEAQYGGAPFDPYQAAYRSSSVPSYNRVGPGGGARLPAPPGMGAVPGFGDPGQTGYPLSEFDAVSPFGLPSPEAIPLPSEYSRLRGLEVYDRSYQPNRQADQVYLEWMGRLQDLFEAAQSETDPERKAELLQRYREVRRRVSLGLSPSASNRLMSERIEGRAPSGSARDESRRGAASADQPPAGTMPRSVRSFDDLLRWSHVVNRQALRRASAIASSD